MSRILLAEDDPALLRLLADTLTEGGYTVVATTNGASAWQLVMTQPFDLVIVDHHLPGMLGGHLCRLVATTPALAAVPLIVISARALAELSTLCPAAMLLTKPFHLSEFRAPVAALCPVAV